MRNLNRFPFRQTFQVILLLLLSISFLSVHQGFLAQEKQHSKTIDATEVEAVIQWLSKNAITLKSLEPGYSFEDLKPLKKILKNIRIVGLGEATHGTREFFQFKHRMLEFLVKEMGFTVLALEDPYPASFRINDYILHGKGDSAEEALIRKGFVMWNTNEFSEMIGWMRDYNKKAPEGKKLKIYGIDIQIPGQAIEVVISYIKKVAPEYTEIAEDAINPLRFQNLNRLKWGRNKEEKAITKSRLLELIGFLALNQVRFIRETSAEEFEKVMQHARTLAQFNDTFSRPRINPKDPTNSMAARRDFYMAETIDYIMNKEGPEIRIVVWAHNSHISLGETRYMYGEVLIIHPSMGSHLRKNFGDAYYALGFTFNQGSFQSYNVNKEDEQYRKLNEFDVGPASEGQVGWYFARPGIENYIVDFRFTPKDEKIADWLNFPLLIRHFGATFSLKRPLKKYIYPIILGEQFDGMIFIGKTTRAHPVRSKTEAP